MCRLIPWERTDYLLGAAIRYIPRYDQVGQELATQDKPDDHTYAQCREYGFGRVLADVFLGVGVQLASFDAALLDLLAGNLLELLCLDAGCLLEFTCLGAGELAELLCLVHGSLLELLCLGSRVMGNLARLVTGCGAEVIGGFFPMRASR